MKIENITKADVFDRLATVVKAVGNGRRLELLELLAQGERSVEDLARTSAMALTTTSAHLQRLKAAGLVRTRRQRTTIYYRLAGDDVAALFVAAERVGLARSPELSQALRLYLTVDDGTSVAATTTATSIAPGATVIDVRPAQEFAGGHLPGALSIPLADLDGRTGEIPAGRPVVVYCRGALCRLARQAAHQLCEQGFDASVMDEGVLEWRTRRDVVLDGVA